MIAPVRTAPPRTTPTFLSRTAVGVVLALSLAKGLSPFAEPDLWWHLRTGDRLRQGSGLTAWDPSASFAQQAYAATQWLPETVASWAYSVGGVGGVLWLRAVAIIALTVVVYAAARRFAGRLPAALTAGLTLMAAGGGLNPRPQLVSFVLFAVTVHACIGMVQDRRPRWWLVPVFWLWACCHGLWIFGLIVGLVMVVSAIADPTTRPAPRELRRLAALWAACLVAVACTPLGPGLLATPFEVANNASMIAEEWRPTPLNNVFAWAALLELLICVVCWAVRPQRRPWWQYALLAFAAASTMWMWRLVPLGAVAAAPLVAAALEDLLTAQRESFTRRERRGLGAAFVGLIAVAALLCATPIGSSASRYPAGMQPIDQALKALPAHTVVLDDFGISGWLLWAHPELRPVADLRGEIYGHDYLVAYQNVLAVKPGWESFVARTRPGAALVARDSALGDALRHRLHWTVAASTKEFLLILPG
jgi:hypothetical protein